MTKFPKQSAIGDDAFFAALARGETVVAAARLTGCSRQALYRRRIRDRAFDRRWRALEDERQRKCRRLSRRCITPVFETPARRPFSNGRLLARLKALRPDVYRSR
jgi:hypothetical protein